MTEVVSETALVETLAASCRGRLLAPEDSDYETARRLYNAMIDKRPRLIARCHDVADVIAAVKAGRDAGVDIAIRGGGHNGPGLGSVDDGLVIDLTELRGVIVDPEKRVAQVLGGTLLGEVDHATQAFGLAAPFGIISTTGVGGLTLGGGVGNLTRTLGLTIDNLIEADVVLADGSFVTTNESKEPDLFWALRGGGGNFGVVTRFAFRLSPIPTVVAGPMLWTIDRGPEVLSSYRDFLADAPDELNAWFGFMTVPPAPPFPDELQLQKVAGILVCWAGDPDDADEALAPLRALEPALDGVQPMPPAAINGAFDPIYPAGEQWYWRSHVVTELTDDAIAENVRFAETLPTWKCTTHFYPISGAASRVAAVDTAWPNRDGGWVQVIVGVDADAANAALVTDWARSYSEAVQPYAAAGGYVNMIMEEGDDRIRAIYGPNYDRLAQVKARYDPDNLFHVNQNIGPA
jgi:FAD/FMN-containing dehydrogenase